MQLSKSDIKQFQSLYQKHFGMELDDKQAHQKLHLLVRQMEIVYRPITKQQAMKYGNGENHGKVTSKN